MKLFITLFILLAGCLTAFSADFWEPLDGPYGGEISGAVQTDNYLFVYNTYTISRSSDMGNSWSSCFNISDSSYVDKLILTSDKKLYVVCYKSGGTGNQFFVSTDEGANWTFMKFFSDLKIQGDITITNKFIYSRLANTLTYCNLKDSTIFHKKLAKSFNNIHIDNSDNIYLFQSWSIYISDNMADSFKEIAYTQGYIDSYAFDKNDNLFYLNSDSIASDILYTKDKGMSWYKILSPVNCNNFYLLDENNFYVGTNDNWYWLVENGNTVHSTKLWQYNIDSINIFKLIITKDVIIACKSNYTNYISSDKFLNNLKEIKQTWQNIKKLSGGKYLLLSGGNKLSYLNKNQMLDFNNQKACGIGYNNFFTSQKYYYWYTQVGLALPETFFSSDKGVTVKEQNPNYSPFSMDENSKSELFEITCTSRLAKSSDQINWVIINTRIGGCKQIFIDKKDDLFIITDNRTQKDSLYLLKLDGSNYNELSKKFLNLSGKFVKAIISQNSLMFILTSNTVFRTSDEGTTLEVVLDGTAKGRVFRDILAVKDIIYIATDKGVLISEDNGITWSDFNDGLNTANCLSLAKTGDNTVYVGLSQDVVYRSTKLTDIPTTEIPSDFLIQPNPAEEYIEISVGAQGSVPNPDIRIFNVFGEIVVKSSEVLNNSQFSIPNSQLRIDVSGLPSGVYFVKVGDKVGKFVKI